MSAPNLAAHSAFPLAKHAPRSGERVLDIGCGVGETTLDLARLVGPKGCAVGLDSCEASLEAARRDAKAAGLANVTFVAGDAQTHFFDGSFDLFFARFGTMFFRAPQAALRNIRNALRPGGRLLVITWRPLWANPWMSLPMAIVLAHLPPPRDDGRSWTGARFSMADPDVVRALLEGAGFTGVALEEVNAPVVVGRNVTDVIDFQLELGPAAEIVREAGDIGNARRADLLADLRAGLEPFVTPRGVVMDSSSWCITGTNPS